MLIFAAGINVALEAINAVSWLDNFVLQAGLSSPPPRLDGKLIYPCSWKPMEATGFQTALQDPNPTGNLLDELLEDWNSCHQDCKPAFCNNVELWRMKQELT